MAQDRHFSADQVKKLKQIIAEGVSIMTEIDDLNAGLTDTIKTVAEEMGIKAAVLKKAIKVSSKATYQNVDEDHQLLTDILESTGRIGRDDDESN